MEEQQNGYTAEPAHIESAEQPTHEETATTTEAPASTGAPIVSGETHESAPIAGETHAEAPVSAEPKAEETPVAHTEAPAPTEAKPVEEQPAKAEETPVAHTEAPAPAETKPVEEQPAKVEEAPKATATAPEASAPAAKPVETQPAQPAAPVVHSPAYAFWKLCYDEHCVTLQMLHEAVKTASNPYGYITPAEYQEICGQVYVQD